MWCPSNYLTPHIESHPIPPIQQLSGTALNLLQTLADEAFIDLVQNADVP